MDMRKKEKILSLQNVKTYYGKIHALRSISCSVRKGEIVTLLGGNGAGKSTTLRTISGLNQATSGTITFMDEDITAKQPHEIVGMGLIHVPEGRRIFKGMTIRENLELGSFTLKDDAERRKRMDHVFEIFPVLHERRNRDSAMLSGGEQQMLAMGRALMIQPRLLLLDEPSMGLAPFLVKEIMRIILRLNKEGVTILLVEQNARVALQLASYGYVLETGKIVIEGEAETLRHDESIIKAYLGE
jgi:branched-chain amino acid transport system ATP-binding protein